MYPTYAPRKIFGLEDILYRKKGQNEQTKKHVTWIRKYKESLIFLRARHELLTLITEDDAE